MKNIVAFITLYLFSCCCMIASGEEGEPFWFQKYILSELSEEITISKNQAEQFNAEPDSIDHTQLLQLALCLYEGKYLQSKPSTAVKYLSMLSDQDDARAQRTLAECYLLGGKIDKDRNKALSLLEKAVQKKDPTAEYLLAALYLDSLYATYDYEKAYEILKKYESGKNIRLAPNLALCYLWGYGTEQNVSKGAQILEETRHTNIESSFYYHVLRCYGGLYQEEAINRLRELVKEGFEPAAIELGYFYLHQNNDQEAIDVLEPLAEQDNALAQILLARVYQYKQAQYSIEKSLYDKQSKDWTLRASDNGSEIAKSNLGNSYTTAYINNKKSEDRVMALHYLEELYNQKYITAIIDVSKMVLWDEKSIEIEKAKAFKDIENLAKKDCPEAKFIHAAALLRGVGCKQNQETGFRLIKKEAENGDVDSMSYLADCYENGNGTPVDLKLALYWYQKAEAAGKNNLNEKIEHLEKRIKEQ